MAVGWIWTDNLRPLLVELGLLVSYRFDDSDWIAVEYGLAGTDSESGPWFEYPIGHLMAKMALEPGADEMTSVLVEGATAAELQKIRWLGDMVRNWHLADAASVDRPRQA